MTTHALPQPVGGKLFTPDNELNAFTMNGIGSQSQFNFIQGHAGKDDCIEWFGGTINMNHLVSSACADDGLDKPPKNMLPIYALIAVVVIAGAIVAFVLLNR
jgi:hypothetical protein